MSIPCRRIINLFPRSKVLQLVFYLFCLIFVSFVLFLYAYPVRSTFTISLTQSTKIYDRSGVLLYETLASGSGRSTYVKLGNLPKFLVDATIATEDQNFYSHSGISARGIFRALYLNLSRGEVISGGSTITQQLVRNVLGTQRKRTIGQKIKESLIALRVSKEFTKDEVLEMYLNTIYYGNLNYGVSAASRWYFGKQVTDLDLAESAFLAGLPQAPSRYNPFEHREDALKRKDYVLSLMRASGFISDAQMQEASAEKLTFEHNLVTVRAPHFVNYVIDELEDSLGETFVSAGLEVKTTLDFALHQRVQEIARRNLALLAGRNVQNASVVVLDPERGDILAMLGSIDYFNTRIDGQVNVALRSRQPGSALKPIVYAAAFEKGWNGATLIQDEPVRFFSAQGTPYLPKNYDYEYHGLVTVRQALANSYNIPAVKTADFVSVGAVLDQARVMGITTLTEPADHYGLALALGDGEVRLLDLVNAYSVFANGGIKKEPRAILEIRNARADQVFFPPPPPPQRVVSEEVSFMITDILSDNAARIPEFGLGNVLELDRPAAAKTGTTRNFRDNWTVGFTPDFVAGVWVGNNDNTQMRNVSGVYGAGPLWHDVMVLLHRGKPKREFGVPAGIEKKEICISEPAPDVPCEKFVSEWVLRGTHRDPTPASPAQSPLRIKKPFDLDVFQFNPNADRAVQQTKFEVEKASGVGEVTWLVNGTEVGTGDSIFWPLERGEFEIEARAGESSDRVGIRVE